MFRLLSYDITPTKYESGGYGRTPFFSLRDEELAQGNQIRRLTNLKKTKKERNGKERGEKET